VFGEGEYSSIRPTPQVVVSRHSGEPLPFPSHPPLSLSPSPPPPPLEVAGKSRVAWRQGAFYTVRPWGGVAASRVPTSPSWCCAWWRRPEHGGRQWRPDLISALGAWRSLRRLHLLRATGCSARIIWKTGRRPRARRQRPCGVRMVWVAVASTAWHGSAPLPASAGRA
jgi:hypothetical protein